MRKTWIDKVKRNKNTLMWSLFAFGITLSVSLLIFLILKHQPFGQTHDPLTDMRGQYYPFLEEFFQKLKNGESLFWSWKTGGGVSFWPILCYYLLSPLNLLALPFTGSRLESAMLLLILLRQALAAFSMTLFLSFSKKGRPGGFSAVGGVLYAGCGWFALYYFNCIWLDAFWLLPLTALGIERIIRYGRPVLYILSFTGTLLTNYYMGYIVSIFCILYFLFFFFTETDRETTTVKKTPFLHAVFFRRGFLFFYSSVFSAALLGVILLPLMLQLLKSQPNAYAVSRAGSSGLWFSSVLSLFSGLTSGSKQLGSYPALYCGLLSVTAFPLFFFLKTISRTEKIWSACLAAFFILSLFLPALDSFWHGLRTPSGVPFRETFVFSFFAILILQNTLLRLHELPKKAFAVSGCLLLVLLAAAIMFYILNKKYEMRYLLSVPACVISLLLFLCFTLLLFSSAANKSIKPKALLAVLLALCVFDTGFHLYSSVHSYAETGEDTYTEQTETAEQLLNVNPTEESGRIYTHNATLFLNYGALYGKNAIEHMASGSGINTVFFEELGAENNGSSLVWTGWQTPMFHSIFGIGTLIDFPDTETTREPAHLNEAVQEGYSLTAKEGGVGCYSYAYKLPLGFLTDDALTTWELQKNKPFENQSSFFELACGAQSLTYPCEVTPLEEQQQSLSVQKTGTGDWHYEPTQDQTEIPQLVFQIKAKTNGCVYLYINVDENTSANWLSGVTKQNGETYLLHPSNRSILTNIGYAKTGETVSVLFQPAENTSGVCTVSAVQMNMQSYYHACQTLLNNGSLEISEMRDDRVSGSVTVSETEQLLCTSIPAADGWSVTVDGEKLPESALLKIGGGLLGVRLSEGTHSVQFRYRLPGFEAGLGLSIFAILCAALYILIRNHLRKKD